MTVAPSASFVDPYPLFCNVVLGGENRCITHEQGTPLYFDDDHLSYVGSHRVVAQIVSLLKEPDSF